MIIGLISAALVFLPSKPNDRPAQVVSAQSAAPAVEPSKPEAATGIVKYPITSKPKVSPLISAARPVESDKPKEGEDVPPPATTSDSGSGVMHVELEAREPAWVSITDVEGKHLYAGVLQTNETRSIDLTKGATSRTGNAGGLGVRFNGKEIGTIGLEGKIRDIEFHDGAFKIL